MEDLCQHLSKKSSVVSPAEAQEMISSVLQALLLVENYLKNIQEADLKVKELFVSLLVSTPEELYSLKQSRRVFFHVQRIQQRLLWWEELMGLLHSQPALRKQEVSLRLGSIVTMMEQLTSDDALTFSDMETILSDVRTTLNEGLHMCIEGEEIMRTDSVKVRSSQ